MSPQGDQAQLAVEHDDMTRDLDTQEQRREAARPFLAALANHVPQSVTLFGIQQDTLDLLDFRQDCLERLAVLQADPNAIEEREEVCAEFDACDRELKRLAGAEVQKVDNIANLLRMCDRMIEHRAAERDRQNTAKKRWESIKEGVEQMVMEALTLAERTRFDSPTNTLRMQRNSSPRVDIVDPQAVQDRFIKVTLEVTVDRWKQMREAQPDLVVHFVEKERSFITGIISKVLRAATSADAAIEEQIKDPRLASEAKKQVERVRGAKLVHGKHLRCE
jgi:hypothetical protein